MNDINIIELPPFSRAVKKMLTKKEIDTLCRYLAQNPREGDVIRDTGGIRKLRWAVSGKGKRGGARVIYFYHVMGTTIYLMGCYSKSDQTDISPQVKKELKAIVGQIKKGV